MILLLNDTAGTQAAADPGLSGLVKVLLQPDVVSLLGCVLVALVMVVCVVRWLMVSTLLRRAEAADAEFTRTFRNSAHALGLFQSGETFDGSPRSALYTNTCRELAFQLVGSDVVDKNFSIKLRTSGRIVPSQWEATQRAARRSFDEEETEQAGDEGAHHHHDHRRDQRSSVGNCTGNGWRQHATEQFTDADDKAHRRSSERARHGFRRYDAHEQRE
jgi:hypothetical protein